LKKSDYSATFTGINIAFISSFMPSMFCFHPLSPSCLSSLQVWFFMSTFVFLFAVQEDFMDDFCVVKQCFNETRQGRDLRSA